MSAFKTIHAEDLRGLDLSNGIILDVRTKMEHAEKRLGSGHAHVVLDDLEPLDFMMRHGLDRDSKVYILCRSGVRASQAAEKFVSAGYSNAYVIQGGLIACEECGHDLQGYGAGGAKGPALKSAGPVSLERQVRIMAGIFVLVGSLLGVYMATWFMLIPVFVGASLVFAGVTDWCAAALVLTKAPWNRAVACQPCGVRPAGAQVGESCQ